MDLYKFLNYFFFAFHTVLIFFNTFGWIVLRTRKLNLLTLSLTASSWFILGIFYGWDYCFCTDWHWQVRSHLGYEDKTNSYIQFLLIKITCKSFQQRLVDQVTAVVFFSSFIISIALNIRDYRNRKNHVV